MNYGYDFETYPNFISCAFKCVETGERWYYEISERANDLYDLVNFFITLRDMRASMIGFNNLHFDYPIVHFILEHYHGWVHSTKEAIISFIYEFAMTIINSKWHERFNHVIWQPVIHQIDLLKIHHFDNENRRTSLKMLEFNMHSHNIGDLPFPPGTFLQLHQLDTMKFYNMEDVEQTLKFHAYSIDQIEFRAKLSKRYNRDFTNFSDPKIGAEIIIDRLGKDKCYYYDQNNKRQPRQTKRDIIHLKDVVFPYIKFNHPEFQRIHQFFLSQSITQTKGVFDELECVIDGFKYKFGLGGIHASVEPCNVVSDEYYEIVDIDVGGFYPSLEIVNNLYPEHLGAGFPIVLKTIVVERRTYAKKTAENDGFKLAGNAAFGQSNSKFSPFLDPQFTMATTVNGQLLLCMLSELLMTVQGLTMIQFNTDGVTVKIPRVNRPHLDMVCRHWEVITGLELESVNYHSMKIRDVGNYIGVFEDGSTKDKGAYVSAHPDKQTPKAWHKDLGGYIIPKAAKAVLVDGVNLVEYITSPERDVFDFMMRTKTPYSSKLMYTGGDGVQHPQQKVTRYHIAHDGGYLVKHSPPTSPHTVGTFKKAQKITDAQYFQYDPMVWNEAVHTKKKSINGTREDRINAGWQVAICNNMDDFNPANLNHAYYIAEARKLIDPILKRTI